MNWNFLKTLPMSPVSNKTLQQGCCDETKILKLNFWIKVPHQLTSEFKLHNDSCDYHVWCMH